MPERDLNELRSELKERAARRPSSVYKDIDETMTWLISLNEELESKLKRMANYMLEHGLSNDDVNGILSSPIKKVPRKIPRVDKEQWERAKFNNNQSVKRTRTRLIG